MNKDKETKKRTLIYSHDLKPPQVICRTDVRHQLTSLKKSFSGHLNLNIWNCNRCPVIHPTSIYLSQLSVGEKWQTLCAGRDTDAPSGQVETPISARPHVFEVLEGIGAPGGDTLASHRRSSAGPRDSSYCCVMFFLNWNIVLRPLLSPSSRHTPLFRCHL